MINYDEEKNINKNKKYYTTETLDALVDGETILNFTIVGRPATKKTHQQAFLIHGRPRVLPSKQYINYEKNCKNVCESVWKNEGLPPIPYGVKIKIFIYLDSWIVGDHVGYLQSLGDIFEKFGIIEDDKLIFWDNDSEHWFKGIDKLNPRVEVEIQRFRHPYEEYKKEKNKPKKKEKTKNAKDTPS